MAELERNAPRKPLAGEYTMERKAKAKALKHHEDKEILLAKIRDGRKCRAPYCQFKELRVEGAHAFQHRGMGGDPRGTRTARKLIVTLCIRHHQELDKLGLLSCEPMDAEQMADGCLAWYRPSHDTGRMECFAVETRIGVSVSRT